MGRVLRRVRGAIGMGLVWAVGCGLVGGVPRWILGIRTDAPFAIVFGLFGFVAGVVFSVILALVEGRRRIDQLSVPRVAAWGAAGGLLLGVLWATLISLALGEAIGIAAAFAMASAGCAAGSLALAKRALPREAIGAGTDDAALGAGESQELMRP